MSQGDEPAGARSGGVLVERSKLVPKAARDPAPGWKSAPWASDVLPKKR